MSHVGSALSRLQKRVVKYRWSIEVIGLKVKLISAVGVVIRCEIPEDEHGPWIVEGRRSANETAWLSTIVRRFKLAESAIMTQEKRTARKRKALASYFLENEKIKAALEPYIEGFIVSFPGSGFAELRFDRFGNARWKLPQIKRTIDSSALISLIESMKDVNK